MSHSREMLTTLAIGSLIAVSAVSSPQSFHWDWHDAQELSPKRSLQNAKLPENQRRAIAKAISAELNDQSQSQQQLRRAALKTSIKMVDLNSDGVPEVIAQGVGEDDCSPTGNCTILIFQRVHGGYKLLLTAFGQTFTIQKMSTNGFHDIVVASHGSAFDSGLTNYKYRNGSYREAGCYDARWQVPGTDTILKEPRITRCSR